MTRKIISNKIHNTPSITMLSDKWKEYDYQAVYDTSAALLEKKTFNNTVLVYRGYAAFYLAVSATESQEAQDYIEESIHCLRLALMDAKKKTLGQIQYMLGKAYFYKNSISSYHYYADLAVEYLTKAKESGYKADDIPEYLGLSYAQLNMTMESIAAFSEALLYRESDALLLSIAEQYSKAEQNSAAKQYLFQIIQRSNDDSLVIKSRILLGNILLKEKDFDGAQKEFEAILQKNDNSADAHYGMGLIYENNADLAKARSEWRKTLRIQVNHVGALEKIQQYK
ncbi:MAG: hypothetical protein K6A42_01965 [Treponema sp.]|nr:hypothetical protein [Treponema sp.]